MACSARRGPFKRASATFPTSTAEVADAEAASTEDHRLMNAVTDPSDGTVWTTHAISANRYADGDLISAVRWYQIDPAQTR